MYVCMYVRACVHACMHARVCWMSIVHVLMCTHTYKRSVCVSVHCVSLMWRWCTSSWLSDQSNSIRSTPCDYSLVLFSRYQQSQQQAGAAAPTASSSSSSSSSSLRSTASAEQLLVEQKDKEQLQKIIKQLTDMILDADKLGGAKSPGAPDTPRGDDGDIDGGAAEGGSSSQYVRQPFACARMRA